MRRRTILRTLSFEPAILDKVNRLMKTMFGGARQEFAGNVATRPSTHRMP